MRNTAEATDRKSIAAPLQTILGVRAISYKWGLGLILSKPCPLCNSLSYQLIRLKYYRLQLYLLVYTIHSAFYWFKSIL
jgi:hypothetical protein